MEPEARARLERVAVANRQWADMWEAAGLEPDLQVASRHVGLDIDAALAEIDRLAALNDDKFKHIDGYCKAADEDRAEIQRLAGLLRRAVPIVRNDVLMCDSLSRHGNDVIGSEDAAKVEAAEYSSLVLLREICAATGESTGLYGEP